MTMETSAIIFGAESVFDIVGDKRALNSQVIPHSLRTESQMRVMNVLALIFSALSVGSSIVCFYWFIKMRRSFRHDLIMFLIQSDMFKALWFMVYPIVVFIHGRPASSSIFCQVNGFLLLVGVEASDFAVLMIAVHSALYIFQPNSGGEGGLYPYRKYAFGICILLPVLLASLAFINPRDAYVSNGTFCYLPVRPFWYRLSLNWIPRYVIFATILIIYASIYIYVWRKFAGFNNQSHGFSSAATATNDLDDTALDHFSPSTLPPLVGHGFITESPRTSMHGIEPQKPTQLLPPPQSRRPSMPRRASVHQFMLLASFTNREHPRIPSITSEVSIDLELTAELPTPQPIKQSVRHSLPPNFTHSAEVTTSWRSTDTSWENPFGACASFEADGASPKQSVVDMSTILSALPTSNNNTNNELSLNHVGGHSNVDLELLRTRDKILRQLRFLFIYPIVYMAIWIVPFVFHVLQYNDRYALYPNFALSCVVTVCIAVQAAVDAWLFGFREKPWRHIPDTDGSLWESLKFWTGWHGVKKRRVLQGPGLSRDEMAKEARGAYKRRDVERAEQLDAANAEAVGAEANRTDGTKAPQKAMRSWWDFDSRDIMSGGDGGCDSVGISPISEEGDPLAKRRRSIKGKFRRKSVWSKDENATSGVNSGVTTLRNSLAARSRDIQEEEEARIQEQTRTAKIDEGHKGEGA